jgi:two-component system NtrC family sensor kinase
VGRCPAPGLATRILVVEDEPLLAQLMLELLADEGRAIDIAANGRIALEQLEEHAYDLILSDLRMPELDGVGFYTEVKRRRPDVVERMVFVTGTMEAPAYREFLAQTGVPVLAKPFNVGALDQVVHRMLAKDRDPMPATRGDHHGEARHRPEGAQ